MLSYSREEKHATIYPIQISKGHSGVLPSISRKQSILEKIIDMSRQYQTNIIIDKNMLGCVKW